MGATSNAGDLVRDLKALIKGFNFADATVEGETLGRDCVGIVVDGIAERSIDQEMGSTGPWAPNAPRYAAWKAHKYSVDGPNRRTGQMLSHESLYGTTVISTATVEMNYGTGKPSSGSATGMGFDSRRDGETSDIEKAWFATRAGRDFYFLDDTISERVFVRIEECLEQYLVSA